MTGKIKFHHSAGGLLLRGDSVLTIHWDQPRDSYDFPKGHLEADETPDQTAVREIYEETGYQTRVIAPIGQTYYEYEWTDGSYIKKTVDYFLVERTEEVVVEPQRELYETFENVWLSITEATALLTRDVDKELLKKAVLLRQKRSEKP